MIFTDDIEFCFWDPARELPPGKERGVLMSKLATNELSGGRVGFKKFVETYGGLASTDAETIYRLIRADPVRDVTSDDNDYRALAALIEGGFEQLPPAVEK